MLTLLLCLLFFPQEATLLGGAVVDGKVEAKAFGVGDGGIGTPVVPREKLLDGQALTRGGVLVRAQAEGVKVDFPSGGEVLIARDGAVHLRDGSKTLPAFWGLTLRLTDGERIVVIPASGGREPLDLVAVGNGEQETVLWRNKAHVREAAFTARDRGVVLWAGGDGSALYEVERRGPLVKLRRVLCAVDKQKTLPREKLVVLADVLAESMLGLPDVVPQKTVDFPQGYENANALALLARGLFPPRPIVRPPGAVGEIVFELEGGYRLQVGSWHEKLMRLTLQAPPDLTPVAEWTIGSRTLLHLCKPDGSHYRKEIVVEMPR